MTPMRRAAILILLLALLGASTSLGVAWFIGGVQPEWAQLGDYTEERIGAWDVSCSVGLGQRNRHAYGFDGEVEAQSRSAPAGSVFAQPPRDSLEAPTMVDGPGEFDVGWPILSWRTVWHSHPSGYGEIEDGDLHGGLLYARIDDPNSMGPNLRFLPLRPIRPAVVLDSAFWAGVWLVLTLLLMLPGVLRRRLRLRRHRCTICGYDLRGIDAALCSECGAARGARGPMLGNRLLGSLGVVLLLLVIAQITIGAKVAGLSQGPHRLHFAARDGDLSAIERALRNGVPVDVAVGPDHDAAGTTPLIWAIASNQVEAVRVLLDRGADPKAQNEDGRPAIVLATEMRNEQVFAALLAKGADPDTLSESGQPVMYWLIGEEGGAACAQRLIDAGADVNTTWGPFSLLAVAAHRNDVAFARLLIDAGARVNAPVENLPIITAIQRGDVEMSRLLIESGAEIARAELDLLRLAVESGNVELVTLLLVHGAPRAVVGESATPLHVAVARCDTDMVRFLTASGFDPTVPDEHGRTPFEQAIEASLIAGEYDEIVRILDAAVRAWYRDGGDADGG